MLQGMTWASPPDLLMPSATSLQASALRLEITTLAPSFASNSAEDRPMPRLEPVMTATVPVRSNGVFFILFVPSLFLVTVSHSSCPGLTRASTTYFDCPKTWMAGSSPAMTTTMGMRPDRRRRGLHQSPTLRDAAEVVVGVAQGVFHHSPPP